MFERTGSQERRTTCDAGRLFRGLLIASGRRAAALYLRRLFYLWLAGKNSALFNSFPTSAVRRIQVCSDERHKRAEKCRDAVSIGPVVHQYNAAEDSGEPNKVDDACAM